MLRTLQTFLRDEYSNDIQDVKITKERGHSRLTRGEALRQAMMALADGPGYIGADGETIYLCAPVVLGTLFQHRRLWWR